MGATLRAARKTKAAARAAKTASFYNGTVTGVIDATHCRVAYGEKEVPCVVPASLLVSAGDTVQVRVKGNDYSVSAVLDGEHQAQWVVDTVQDAKDTAEAAAGAAGGIAKQASAPTGFVVAEDAVESNAFGEPTVVGRFSWTAVTTDTDGDPVTISQYEVLGQPQTAPASSWRTLGGTSGPSTSWSYSFLQGTSWRFTVRARVVGSTVPGAQSVEVAHTFGVDTVPPNGPSTPTASSVRGSAVIGWDGLDHFGGAMPLDFDRCEIHIGTSSGFTPSAATRKGIFVGRNAAWRGGTFTLSGLTLGATYWVKLVAYDLSGNASAPSAAASWVQQAIVTADMAQDAIDAIKDYTITEIRPTIDGKNTITASTANPSLPYAGVAGDRWEKYTAGKLVGTWRYDGAAWVSTPLDPAYIPQIDIGAGTFGSLSGSRLEASSVLAKSLFIGDFTNQAGDNPSFETGDLTGWVASGAWLVNTTSPRSGTYKALTAATGVTQTLVSEKVVKVTPGDTWVVSGWAYTDLTGTGAAVSLGLLLSTGGTAVMSVPAANGGWNRYTYTYTVPNGVTSLQVRAAVYGGTASVGGYMRVDDFYLRRASAGELLVDGSVTANKMSTTDLFVMNALYGPEDGVHLLITPNGGLQAFAPDPDAAGAIGDWLRVGTADSGDGLSVGFDPDNPVARINSRGNASFQSVSTEALRVAGDTLDVILARLPQGRMAYAESTSPPTGIAGTETGIVELRAVLQPGRTYSIAAENIAVLSSAGAVQVRQAIRYALDGAAVSTASTALRLNATDYVHPSGVYIGQPDLNATIRTDGWGAAREIRFLYSVWLYAGSGTVNVWGGSLQPLTLTIRDEGPAMAPTTTAKLWTSVWNCSAMYKNGAGSALTINVFDSDNVHALFNNAAISGEAVTVAAAMTGATLLKAEVGTYYSKPGDFGLAFPRFWASTATAATNTTAGSNTGNVNIWPPSKEWVDLSALWTTASRSVHVQDATATLLNTTAHPLQLRLTYLR